ncbi:MAG: transcriptional repressor [Nitrospirae bacterium]|nr:transcriptional repressor [Nitrospirota bacterium]
MENIISKYKDKGIRLTPQRIAILKFLEGNTDHPAAEDIYRKVRRRYPTISFATVYNTLQTLTEKGDLLEITIDPTRRHYDPNTTPHHHIVCTDCNEIMDVFVDYSDVLTLPSHVLREFKPVGNHVDFYGVCRKCQKKKGGEN